MGVVYKAHDQTWGGWWPSRSSRHALPGPPRPGWFRREARAAALLHHTNIVPIFAVGVHEDVHYYAMQYIHGQSLDSVLREIIRQRRDPGAEKTILQVRSDNISARLATGLLAKRFGVQPVQADLNTLTPTPIPQPVTPSGATRSSTDARARRLTVLHRSRRSSGPRRRITSAAWRDWACRRRRPSPMRTVTGFSTETSSRPTCFSTSRERSG